MYGALASLYRHHPLTCVRTLLGMCVSLFTYVPISLSLFLFSSSPIAFDEGVSSFFLLRFLVCVCVDRMPLHIPANCPAESFLPSQNGLTLKLGDNPLSSSNPPEVPYVFVFRSIAPWSPYTLAVWHTTIEVPRRLHRFARLFFRLSFRFLSGTMT